MTIQALRLLHKLKKAQMKQDGEVYIDYKKGTLKTVAEVGQKEKTVYIKKQLSNVPDVIEYLESEGYLIIENLAEYIHLKHKGFHYKQIALWNIILFLFKSILVPIVVAAITAYITVWVTTQTGA